LTSVAHQFWWSCALSSMSVVANNSINIIDILSAEHDRDTASDLRILPFQAISKETRSVSFRTRESNRAGLGECVICINMELFNDQVTSTHFPVDIQSGYKHYAMDMTLPNGQRDSPHVSLGKKLDDAPSSSLQSTCTCRFFFLLGQRNPFTSKHWLRIFK